MANFFEVDELIQWHMPVLKNSKFHYSTFGKLGDYL